MSFFFFLNVEANYELHGFCQDDDEYCTSNWNCQKVEVCEGYTATTTETDNNNNNNGITLTGDNICKYIIELPSKASKASKATSAVENIDDVITIAFVILQVIIATQLIIW